MLKDIMAILEGHAIQLDKTISSLMLLYLTLDIFQVVVFIQLTAFCIQ